MLTLTSIVVYCNDFLLLIKDSLVQLLQMLEIKKTLVWSQVSRNFASSVRILYVLCIIIDKSHITWYNLSILHMYVYLLVDTYFISHFLCLTNSNNEH